ncbi:site-specific integrase [Vibrio sp. HN007]|uniref:site-specific integrase n=1 Tax=Vibrio iocasae TaxID=3098914 RepID=UPI0035D3DB83
MAKPQTEQSETFVYIGKDARNGNRPFVEICTPNHIPVSPWVSTYISIGLSGSAFNTKLAYVRQLKFALDHFAKHGIVIEKRVASGQFFSLAELNRYRSACLFKTTTKYSNIISITPHSDKTIENAMHSGFVAESTVKNSTARKKIDRLIEFIEFLFTYMHADKIVPADAQQRYNFTKTHLKGLTRDLKDYNQECVSEGESAIPTHAFLRLLDIIKPESPDNPFKKSRFRNYLIVQLYIETGNRRGDHAGLKIEDIRFYGEGNEIEIVRRSDDPTDTRKYIPSTKTQSHLSHVPRDLLRKVKKYIDEERGSYTASKDHSFVFVSENNTKGTAGQPLSLSSIDKIFETLSLAIGFKIHCHLLRHKFNEVLDDIATENKLTGEELDKMRKYLMGWSRESKMVEVYNRYKIYQKSIALSIERQEQMNRNGNERN